MANRAAQLAQQEGKTVIKRDRRALHFDMGGGQRRAVITVEPLHCGANYDQEIDTSWKPTSGVWQWKMELSSFHIHAKAQLNTGQILEWVQPDTGENLTLQPMALNWVNHVNDAIQQISMPQPITSTVNDDVMTWQNGYGTGRHFRYTVHPRRLIKHLIIDSLASLPNATVSNPYLELSFIFLSSAGSVCYIDGQEWDKKTKTNTVNQIEFRNTAGDLLWYFDAPVATDASGNVCSGIFQVRKSGNSQYCTVRFPKTWIDTAVFPIEIDPTFTDGYGGDANTAYDTWVASNSSGSNFGTNTALRFNGAGIHQSLILFTLSSLVGQTINSATLYLYCTGTAANTTINFYRILSANSAWTETGATWDYAVASTTRWAGDAAANGGTDAGCSQSGTDYSSTSMGALSVSSGDTAGTERSQSLDTTEFTTMVSANYGIKGNGGDTWYACSSDHATTGYRPKLVVDYTAAGGKPWYAYAQQ